ncbi:amidase family protein [Umezawaea tangerina]|uniref:Mandelamide amidase n=1 Tax=Umezawaea tangerina TaxID=84725 RepID=A0A2T0TGI6_9PSEU|nr:amidase family protein [Umezawaea tangerina]PRY44741.1 mandelamide amidase [Umezawaea tangerina]
MDGDPRALSLRQWRGLDPVERAERVDECVAMAEESAHGDWVRVAVSPSTGDGPLAGIPFSVKDNIDAAGFTTTAGSPLVPEAPAEVDAGVVAVLRDAGGVVVGKTNMHELALGITGNNTAYGPVRNPADPARSAGGSSGGSAVGVALGVVPFGLGTDTGGSVTIPASFCGVVGFRPSTGRYPGDGLVAISSSRDTAGLHARTVADVRFLDELVTSVPGPAGGGVEGLRVGVPRSRYEDVDPEVDEVSRRALSRLAEAGAVLVEVDVPDDLAVGAGPGIELVLYEAPRLLVARLGRAFEEIVAGTASPDVRGLLELMLTSPIPAERYRAARAAGLRLRRGYAEVFGGVDVLVGPTVPVAAPLIGEDAAIVLGGRAVPTFATVTRNTGPGTVAGVPMVSLPAGTTADGLPVGMCLEGPVFDDARLLAVAEDVESVLARE